MKNMTVAPGHQWTSERVAELSKLWASGLSASEIGRRLGITKNSVIGKARRLDLAMRRQPSVPRKPKVVTLERLTSTMCSWPDGEPGKPEFRFCGAPAVSGKPYCEAHCSLAYLSTNPKSRREKAAA
ncbi:MAG: GcrA family cell cycle regulator [Rhodospirillales bacterium]|nr:GcrA family cell cycle regulator [Rhodospirillales bacterium]